MMRFPIPVFIFQRLSWSKGLLIIGVVEIVLSLIGFFVYLMLHVIPATVDYEAIFKKFGKHESVDTMFDQYCLFYLTIEKPSAKMEDKQAPPNEIAKQISFFHAGMALCEVALIIFAAIGAVCVFIGFKMKNFNQIMCLIVLTGEIFGTCLYFSALIILIVPNHCNLDHRQATVPGHPLTITNMIFVLLLLLTYKPYSCYLIVYLHAKSVGAVNDKGNRKNAKFGAVDEEMGEDGKENEQDDEDDPESRKHRRHNKYSDGHRKKHRDHRSSNQKHHGKKEKKRRRKDRSSSSSSSSSSEEPTPKEVEFVMEVEGSEEQEEEIAPEKTGRDRKKKKKKRSRKEKEELGETPERRSDKRGSGKKRRSGSGHQKKKKKKHR